MRRLRWQFAAFFVVLALPLAFLVRHSFGQLDAENRRSRQNDAEKAFNLMQARVSDFLSAEDARDFADYDAGRPGGSPLSQPPENDPRGLIGYFQIEANGAFHSPYRAGTASSPAETLESLTESLRASLGEDKANLADLSPMVRQAKAPQRQQVYPNPLLKQKAAPPAPKMALSEEKRSETANEVAASAPLLQSFSGGSVGGSGAAMGDGLLEPATQDLRVNTAPEESILLDPFRARLVGRNFLIFYRKAWHDRKMALQGFAVELGAFYDWLMQQSFDNSDLPGFAEARLEMEGETLARHGMALAPATPPLFERRLGYPLNPFTWLVAAGALPADPARPFIAAFGALLTVALTGGLALIYRTAAREVTLSQKRQDFVSAVTHELKTPLTSIRMSAEMLREGWVGDESKRREYYGVIASEGERLGKLIDNVLQLARLEKKTARFNPALAAPNAIFGEIAKELKAFVTANGCSWRQSEDPDLPPIRFDADAMKQILFTLVDNAVKFSRFSAVKAVSLALERKGDKIVWSISDKGPGIPKGELKKAFEKFYRVESELTRKTKGTGIGLAMAKMMAEGMGAEIEAANLGKNEGLSVNISFPVADRNSD